MSDSVVKLRIDSKEYDANIKQAGQALTDYFKKVKEGGGTLKYLDEGVLEAVQAMGKLGTQANSVKGSLRELTQATVDMTAAYRGLTDEERVTPLGQAMAESIQQMTERAGEMRDAMGDVQASIKNAASDTRMFDQLAGGAQLMAAGFQTATGAAEMLGIEMGDNVAVIAKLQAAIGVVNGLQTIQNALQGESAVMMGVQAVQTAAAAAAQTSLAGATGAAVIAQKAFNLVAKANPYVLLATAVAAVGTALYTFASASDKAEKEAKELAKAEEEAKKRADDARNSFVNASAEAMNSANRLSSLQVAYKNANSEIEKTDILKQAQTEFKKLGIECKGVHEAQTLLISKGSDVIELIRLQGEVAAISAVKMEKFKESFKMLMENGYSASAAASLAGYNKDVQELNGQINTMQSRIQNLKGRLGVGGSGGGGRSGGRTTTKTEDTNFASDSIMAQQKEVQRLTDLWQRASGELRDGYLTQLDEAKAKLEQMQKGVYEAGSLDEVVVTGNKNRQYSRPTESNISNVISNIQNELKNADIGSAVFESISARLADANAYKTVIEAGLKAGMSNIAIDNADIWKQIINGDNIPDDVWQGMVDTINEKLKELDIKPIQIDFKTGNIAKDGKDVAKEWGSAANAISAVGSAMSSIEDPAAKVAGTIAQAIATIALTYAQSLKGSFTVWDWIAGAAAGLAQMTAVISSIHASTGYAEGGIVKGNHYSGDMLDGGSFGINAGELVLNRAQQGSLASQLEGGGLRNIQLSAEVKGEQIVLVANRYFRRTGQGEIVTWK